MKLAPLLASILLSLYLCTPSRAHATPPNYSLYGSGHQFSATGTITNIFAQSTSETEGESDVNVIQINAALDSACSSNRVYILPEDKEQFAAALSAKASGTSVNIYYTNNAPTRYAPFSVGSSTCKLIVIYY